jgi:hypothetical protein
MTRNDSESRPSRSALDGLCWWAGRRTQPEHPSLDYMKRSRARSRGPRSTGRPHRGRGGAGPAAGAWSRPSRPRGGPAGRLAGGPAGRGCRGPGPVGSVRGPAPRRGARAADAAPRGLHQARPARRLGPAEKMAPAGRRARPPQHTGPGRRPGSSPHGPGRTGMGRAGPGRGVATGTQTCRDPRHERRSQSGGRAVRRSNSTGRVSGTGPAPTRYRPGRAADLSRH